MPSLPLYHLLKDGLRIFSLELGLSEQHIHIPEATASHKEYGEVAALCYLPASSNTLYAAVGATVVCIDTRTRGGMVDTVCSCNDDVSSIAVSQKGRHLAAADDSGGVQVIDLAAKRVFKSTNSGATLEASSCPVGPCKVHRTSLMVLAHSPAPAPAPAPVPVPAPAPALVPVPVPSPLLPRWDYSRGKLLSCWSMQSSSEELDGPQSFNPPMVHHLALPSELGTTRPWCRMVGIARGDGSVSVFDADVDDGEAKGKGKGNDSKGGGKSKGAGGGGTGTKSEVAVDITLNRDLGGHHAAASSLCWITGGIGEGQKHSDILLASGGDDRRILIWDIGRALSLAQSGTLRTPSSHAEPSSPCKTGERAIEVATGSALMMGEGEDVAEFCIGPATSILPPQVCPTASTTGAYTEAESPSSAGEAGDEAGSCGVVTSSGPPGGSGATAETCGDNDGAAQSEQLRASTSFVARSKVPNSRSRLAVVPRTNAEGGKTTFPYCGCYEVSCGVKVDSFAVSDPYDDVQQLSFRITADADCPLTNRKCSQDLRKIEINSFDYCRWTRMDVTLNGNPIPYNFDNQGMQDYVPGVQILKLYGLTLTYAGLAATPATVNITLHPERDGVDRQCPTFDQMLNTTATPGSPISAAFFSSNLSPPPNEPVASPSPPPARPFRPLTPVTSPSPPPNEPVASPSPPPPDSPPRSFYDYPPESSYDFPPGYYLDYPPEA
eukprot:gene1731-33141_t